MLKLTVSPGETIMIGDDIKIMIGGGGMAYIPIGIEAPREQRIIRSSAQNKPGFKMVDENRKAYVEKALSDTAKEKIKSIVVEERWKNRHPNMDEEKTGEGKER